MDELEEQSQDLLVYLQRMRIASIIISSSVVVVISNLSGVYPACHHQQVQCKELQIYYLSQAHFFFFFLSG